MARVECIPMKQCRLLHAWEPWKVIRRGPGKHYDSDVELAIMERSCTRCGDLQLKTKVSRVSL